MVKKRKMRRALTQAICWMLSASMITPNITPIVTFAAETIENMPRQVDFSEPESLTLEELGIQSDSNSDIAEKDIISTETATSSDASGNNSDNVTETDSPDFEVGAGEDIEVRDPEVFYEEFINEPEGKLVQFEGNLRTYELEEGKYLSIMGGYSGLYEDEDGVIRHADNTLVPVSGAEEEEADETASASNAARAYSLRRMASITYTNEAGAMDVRLPEQITDSKGITIEAEGYEIELVPVSGDYSMSSVDENAIRYSNVYENVDVQYTLVGESVKEDIILLDRDTRTTFSYHLDTDGLKVKRTQDSVLLYDESANDPIFALTAPVMQDAAGEISLDISMTATKQDDGYLVTVEADEDWLEDEDREFPVRIDPSINSGPSGFYVVSVSSANPGTNYLWTKPAYIGYDDGSRTGNHPGYGNTRAYFALGNTNDGWDQVPRDVVIDSATFSVGQQSDWSGGTSRFVLEAPDHAWNIGMTWNEQETLIFTRVGEAFQAVGKDEMYHLDVTEIMKEWLAGTRTQCGLSIRAEEEPPSAEAALEYHHPCELLYNQDNATYGPRLEWVWGGTLPTDVELMEVEDLEVYVNPVVTPGDVTGSRTAEGVLTYGLSQIESEVTYTLIEVESGDIVSESETTAETEAQYPDYTVGGTYPSAFNNEIKDDNWQGEPATAGAELELDTIYRYDVKAVGKNIEEDPLTGELVLGEEEVESDTIETDLFLLYEVKETDILPRIADHYGVDFNQILKDNHLPDKLTVQGDILFIRNPETSEPYTWEMPVEMDQIITDYLLRGRQLDCMYDHEPINMSTGNFYMEQTDTEFTELDGTFVVERSYNSIGAYFRSAFGTGWNSPFDERLMMLEDGRVFYVRGDGAGICFEKNGEGAYEAPAGYDYVLEETEELIVVPETSSNAMEAVLGWRLEDKEGNIRFFNCYGLLTNSTNRKGHTTSYEYEGESRLTKVTTPSGKVLDITMDEENRITEILLPDGTVIEYAYDENDNLISVTNPEGDVRRYEYDDEHRMTAWYDENGTCVIENVYDDRDRVVKQTDAEGHVAELSYEEGCTVSKDNRGNITKYFHDENRRSTEVLYADGSSVKTEYNENGRAVARIDELGVRTTYTYDENGNVLIETRADGTQASFTYNELNLPLTATDYEGNTTVFTYDGVGNLLSMTDAEGNTTAYEYDELSRLVEITDANDGVITFEYDGAVVVAMTDGEQNTTEYTYDAMNRVLTETDPEGNRTEHVYNANGWEIATTAADGGVTSYVFSPAGEVLSITDAMGSETTFTYDKMYNILTGEDVLGNTLTYAYDENYNRIRETDAKGNVTVISYDSRDRQTMVTDALGNAYSYVLDDKGNVLQEVDRRGNAAVYGYDPVLGVVTEVTDELGNVTGYSYDANGNVTEIRYPDGSRVSYRYDDAGRMVSQTAQNGLVTELTYDGNGNIVSITDDESRVYRFVYDKNNRLVKAVDPLGGVTEYAYDGAGNQTWVTDANEHVSGYGYDAMNRLTEVKDALDGVTSTEYNLNGWTTRTTDANGHSTSYFYDEIGELLAQTDAMGYVTAWEYDSLGNITKMTDALKGETVYQYDELSRTVAITDAMGGLYTYKYDENGNLLKVTMPDGDAVEMEYDAANRMISYRDEAGVLTSYEYDSMDRIVKAEDTVGNVMIYEYDESGNLVKQTDTIGRDAIYEYDKFSRLTAVTGTDLARTEYTYDALDRLVGVKQADGTEYAYEYDAVGNLVKTTEPGEAVYTYSYDAINRLTETVNPLGAATTYQYDAVGNLTGSEDAEGVKTSYVYDAINRLTTFTDGRGNNTAYEYDALSRLLSYTTPEGNREEYRYDALGNLTKVRDANELITEYQYDVMGNLMKEISPKGAKTTYTYDKHDELTSITDAAGNITAYEVDLNRLVTKMTQKNGGEYTYQYDAVHRLTDITTPLGLQTTLTYDVADNIVKQADSLDRVNTFEYDIMHRMTKSVNAEGGVTTYGYDIRGNQNTLNDALGYTWNYQYDLVDQLTASVDPEGKATEFAYNLVGEIEAVTKPGARTTSYTYDGNYNVIGITDPKGYLYEYSYDKDDRLTGTKNPLGETETVVYDAGSRVTGITDRMGLSEKYTYDPHGNVIESQATNGLITKFSYDILDNLVKVTLPSQLTATYTYDVMGNVTSATDTMKRVSLYTYDVEGNMTSVTDYNGRTEQMAYDAGGRLITYTSNGGNKIHYDYDKLNDLVEKSYEDAKDPEGKEGVIYAYDVTGQRVSMMDRSGESTYEYDGLGRITKVTTGSGEVTSYTYDEADQLSSIIYADGKSVSYEYDKNDNLVAVTDRTGAVTTYVYDEINRVTEIHRPNGVSTYNTYNARDQIVSLKNICDDCGWVVSQYDYTYDDRGFIVGETAIESLYGYTWDDKHDGKHENGRHDDLFPHGNQHTDKHAKDGEYNFQIVETVRSFEYDDDGKLLRVVEDEEQQGQYIYTYQYDDMGNRTFYSKTRNGAVQESAEYTYNVSNQLVSAKIYDGKKNTTLDYTYDADGNLIAQDGKIGTDKVELTYIYNVENRLKAVYDADELLVAMAYDGDGNRIFQLNYNLHTDDDWKGNSGNGNGNNKDNAGNGNSTVTGTETASEETAVVAAETSESETEAATETDNGAVNGNKDKDKGNNGNDKNNGVGNGNGNSSSGNNGNGNGNSSDDSDTGSDSSTDTETDSSTEDSGTASGNTTNTEGSTNQSSILFPIEGEVSELEQELIDMIKTEGKEKNYELIEYVNDVNREYAEVLMELNINGIMDTAYTYGNERLTNERFTGWTGYYTYDPRGSVSGITDSDGMIWQSYRYDGYGNITFGKPEYNNVYAYNAESYNPNIDVQYLRARYYCPTTADFLTEDTYLGNISDPLTLNRYSYVKSSPLNYVDPSGHKKEWMTSSLEDDVLYNIQKSDEVSMYLEFPDFSQKNDSSNLSVFDLADESEISKKVFQNNESAILEEKINEAVESCYISHCSDGKVIYEEMWQYDVLNYLEELKQGTGYKAYGVFVGGNIMIWSGNLSAAIVTDERGNIALAPGYAFNVGSPEVGISIGGFVQAMPEVRDYEFAAGQSIQSGGSVSAESLGIPGSIGKEVNIIETADKNYYGTTSSYALSLSFSPAEVHAGTTQTEVIHLVNYISVMEDLIWLTVPKRK